ncbi:Carbon-nitrogen hydrolase [Geoalkalibacter ferrihydriticus]|uniref:Carbon-nitrogen hydrolase n=2 Tax=Geoalkalibacter ferrihydriticus TaxID=392333 RepID=A0A0C2HL08_9BACT|nr:carbon-nitrogen family hydrolase [Geoalkalibacter ferrihydriticus]KIH77746.1 carbon-nitrogen hydrolase [Geoalkalibacter ferrihydriticus DSM 17813]SDL76864.1 Carbon-nitrogen hydrolase [Geoalkalibacter ferrihydriticus]
MNRQIRSAAIQFNITLGDVARNRGKAFSALQQAADDGVQLAVLPEMWSTGYDYRRLVELAKETPAILAELQETAARLGLVVVGSLPESEDGKLYNSATVIDRGELRGRYRKLHLFSTMGEDRFLAAGDSTLVVPTSVGRLGVAICYDLRFPELFRKLALEGAEILCLPAEWPKPRQEHWRTLLRARAIENQQFVVAANCCGIQGKLDFFGMSLLISPWGEVLAEGGETDCQPTALFDFEQMTSFRSKIRCFQDRRPEIYGTLP